MEKPIWKSKTVWGAFLFSLASFITSVGWMPENLITELVQWIGGFLGIYGIRDAI